MIKHINSIPEFEEAIKEGEILIDFYADWCGPCKMLAPVLEEVANDCPELNIVKVNVDDLPELAQRYKVQAIPSLFLLQGGIVKNQRLGYANKNELLKFLGK